MSQKLREIYAGLHLIGIIILGISLYLTLSNIPLEENGTIILFPLSGIFAASMPNF